MVANVPIFRCARTLAVIAVALVGALAAGPSSAAEAKRLPGAATLTVIVEAVGGTGRELALAPGVFAVYGPAQEMRISGPVLPDRPFIITARPGDRLTFAVRVGSGDLSVRPQGQGIELFAPSGRPATGNVTARLGLFDPDGAPVAAPALAPYPPLAHLVRVTIH